MRRFVLAAVAVLALAGAGLAVADNFESKATKAVTATFTATTATNLRTSTCTNDDGTFADTKGTYTGTASGSDPSLTGQVRVDVRSLINTTKNLGTLFGKIRIDTASSRDTVAKFDAVYAGGSIVGLARGSMQSPYSRLLATLSAAYSPAGGFTTGSIGSSSAGAAVALTPGNCRPSRAFTEKVEVEGTVTALSATQIMAAGVTCNIPIDLQASVASRVTVGARIEMKCTLNAGVYTLTKVTVKKK